MYSNVYFRSFIIVFYIVILILDITCDDEAIAIDCKSNIIKKYIGLDKWEDIKNSINCPLNDKNILSFCKTAYSNNELNYILPMKSIKNTTCLNNQCTIIHDTNFQFYKCLNMINDAKPLNVKEHCIFKHELDNCKTESLWKGKANEVCKSNSDTTEYELYQLMGIFPCISAYNENILNFKSIQFVCCPKTKTFSWYMKYEQFNSTTIQSELKAYTSAKLSLRNSFKLRQKQIKDRYVLEEKSINIWTKYPILAQSLENKVKKRFRESFMTEMNKEVDLLKELELIHENKMQVLFEQNRMRSRSRLEYTLQETNIANSRIAKALELEFKDILQEAENIVTFLCTLYTEDLADDKINRELIKQNFNKVIIQSWEDVINMIKKIDRLKDEVLQVINIYDIKRKTIIKQFDYFNNNYSPKSSMKNQAKNYIKNIISNYEHEKVPSDVEDKFSMESHSYKYNSLTILLICLSVILAVFLSIFGAFILYKYSNKVLFQLSSAFKKIHPRTKNVFVQIENYPFKNRYNYGNSFPQAQCKTEESFLGVSSVYNYQFNALNKSCEDIKVANLDYSDNSISNINGLENPICRLLDEK